ncbi:MAG TPA: carboxylesterase family protein [Mycobacteriales bacterium]|nr:carboxylesterase family protein [Mycobacteriales bacterium]
MRITGRSRRAVRAATLTTAGLAAVALAVPAATAVFAGPPGSAGAGSDHRAAGSTIVRTDNGEVRGDSRTGVAEWLGIPYAAAPVGDLRWRAPQPAASWTGVRDATQFGNRCVQGSGWDPGYATPKLTEDCLYLNVYAPHTTQRNLPVLVWIHGGGFTGGAGQDTDPRQYVQNGNVVYVTINYRLGALGYLGLPQMGLQNADGPGNFGLLDQQAALRWVQRNIGRFGGDRGNVTIAGQSAGGSSVCDQLSSPAAAGLFARVIIMSGGCSMQTEAQGQTASASFAQAVGCTDTATALACLRGKSAAEILAGQQQVSIRPALGGRAFPLDPATAVRTGRFTRVPVMFGQVHDERNLFVFQGNDYLGHPVTAAQFESTVRATYGANADRVLAAYPLSAYSSPGVALGRLQSDAASYTRKLLDDQFSRYVPTYAYEFAEEQTPQFASIYLLQQQGEPARSFPFGATHVDDLPYLWEYLGMRLPFTDDQLELSDQMITYWSGFQSASDPNARPETPRWPRYHPSQPAWMVLNACETDPGSTRPPAACSRATTGYAADHKFGLWGGIVS